MQIISRIRLRHLLHPFKAVKSLYRISRDGVLDWRAERKLQELLTQNRDRCWCGGELKPFELHQGYGVCAECGCYVNRFPPGPGEFERLYSLDYYWRLCLKKRPIGEP